MPVIEYKYYHNISYLAALIFITIYGVSAPTESINTNSPSISQVCDEALLFANIQIEVGF